MHKQSSLSKPEIGVLGDQQSKKVPKSDDEILSNGGCHVPGGPVYENGAEYHPVIASHGEQKCVLCRCKVRICAFIFENKYKTPEN